MNKHYIYDGAWALVHTETGLAVYRGEILPDFRGDAGVIVGGRAPHKPSSTGRVHTANGGESFPSVYGLKWINCNEE
jgi:hypothetical protein